MFWCLFYARPFVDRYRVKIIFYLQNFIPLNPTISLTYIILCCIIIGYLQYWTLAMWKYTTVFTEFLLYNWHYTAKMDDAPNMYSMSMIPANISKFQLISSDPTTVTVGVIYSVICLVALTGNSFVIFVLTAVLKSPRHYHSPYRSGYAAILALSVVDTLVLLHMPLLIHDTFQVSLELTSYRDICLLNNFSVKLCHKYLIFFVCEMSCNKFWSYQRVSESIKSNPTIFNTIMHMKIFLLHKTFTNAPVQFCFYYKKLSVLCKFDHEPIKRCISKIDINMQM